VQTITGSDAAAPRGRLRVSTQGAVMVAAEQRTRYSTPSPGGLRREARAEARQLLRQLLVKAYRQGDMNVITIALGGERWGGAELNLQVPRSFRESLVETHGGAIDASDLSGTLEVETGGGGIKLDRISGPVRATTAGGQIDLGAMGGTVRCQDGGRSDSRAEHPRRRGARNGRRRHLGG